MSQSQLNRQNADFGVIANGSPLGNQQSITPDGKNISIANVPPPASIPDGKNIIRQLATYGVSEANNNGKGGRRRKSNKRKSSKSKKSKSKTYKRKSNRSVKRR